MELSDYKEIAESLIGREVRVDDGGTMHRGVLVSDRDGAGNTAAVLGPGTSWHYHLGGRSRSREVNTVFYPKGIVSIQPVFRESEVAS